MEAERTLYRIVELIRPTVEVSAGVVLVGGPYPVLADAIVTVQRLRKRYPQGVFQVWAVERVEV